MLMIKLQSTATIKNLITTKQTVFQNLFAFLQIWRDVECPAHFGVFNLVSCLLLNSVNIWVEKQVI